MRPLIFMALVVGVLPTSTTSQEPRPMVLDVQTLCTTGDDCRVKVVMGEGRDEEIVVTAFQANRVGPDMTYFKGDEYGSFDFPNAGLMYMEHAIMLDESGTMRPPSPGDPPATLQTFTTTLSVDPHGHVTFFYGFVHGPSSPLVSRSYLWGYAPTTVKIVGAIGGPRSPIVSREPPSARILKGGAGLRFRFECDADNRCRLDVAVEREDQRGIAITHFPANRLGEDMRYFPAEKQGGTDLLTASATYFVDLAVIVDSDRVMRTPVSGAAPADVETLTSTVTLDDRGHVTFFYRFVRDPASSHVRRFCLWGYSPETLMVADPAENDGSTERAETPRRKRGT